jgi:hypothetical protein
MKRSNMICCAAAVAALIGCGASARAGVLLYSFEAPPVNPDGFGPNGGGATVTQDTIGATNGTHSLKYSVVTGATFVGALTGVVAPGLTPPISPQEIDFDYTIAQGDTFTGGFAVLGITVFGSNAPAGQFGLQAQFAPLVHLEGVAPGTYHASIPLTGATNPLDFTTNQSYNQIFTSSATPAANQLNPSGFEFFLNKSNDAAATVYLDNVMVGPVPEPTSMAVIGAGATVLLGLRRRRQSA